MVRLEVEAQIELEAREISFNSSVVRLEAKNVIHLLKGLRRFNSSVVRLEVSLMTFLFSTQCMFQFQCGAIRRVGISERLLL